MRRLLALLILLAMPATAQTPGTFVADTALSAASLNAAFGLKADQAGTTAALALKADLTNPVIVGATSAVLYCTNYASLQACHDALPSTGGRMILAANTTYTLTARLNISKANVIFECPSWGTILKRDPTHTAQQMVLFSGAGDVVRDCTIDGNSVVSATGDIVMGAANGLAWHIQAINGRGSIQVSLSGANSRLAYSTITGAGADANIYGVWAINHVPVTIDHNTITGAGIDGIGADGAGTIIEGNILSNNHCYTGIGGGQLVTYPTTSAGMSVVGNTISAGCGGLSGGIEINSVKTTVSANTIINQKFFGLALDALAAQTVVTGNVIVNSGIVNNAPGISIAANVGNFQIENNRIIDDQGSPTQTYGVSVLAGTSNNYLIANNALLGNLTAPVNDLGTGTLKSIRSNAGLDEVIPAAASAATLVLPLNPTVSLTGTVGVGAISADTWVGRTVTMIPVGIVVFTAGATIANSVTTVANVPVTAIFNGTNWNLK